MLTQKQKLFRLNIITWNICGLKNKSATVFSWIKNYDILHPHTSNIFSLQETHTTDQDKFSFMQIIGPDYTIIWNNFSHNSRGVCIITKAEHKLTLKNKDNKGRWLEGLVHINNTKIHIVSLYAPADDINYRTSWLENLPWKHWKKNNTILGGDWNTVSEAQDRHSTATNQWKPQKDSYMLSNLLQKNNFKDAWHDKSNIQQKSHTFIHRNHQFSARIDKCIYPKNIGWNIAKVEIDFSTGLLSDHIPLITSFIKEEPLPHGRGYWKLNASILTQTSTLAGLNKIWQEAQDILPTAKNKNRWWDQLTRSLVAYLKTASRIQNSEIQSRFISLSQDLAKHVSDFTVLKSDTLIQQITYLQQEINKINTYRAEGARIRNKKFTIAQAEKPNKYFFARAKAKKMKTQIASLKTEAGTIAKNRQMLEVARKYYSHLYNRKKTNSQAQKRLLNSLHKQLSSQQKNLLDSSITLDDLNNTIATMKKGKSPGPSGLTVELFQVAPFLLEGLLIMWTTPKQKQFSLTLQEMGS